MSFVKPDNSTNGPNNRDTYSFGRRQEIYLDGGLLDIHTEFKISLESQLIVFSNLHSFMNIRNTSLLINSRLFHALLVKYKKESVYFREKWQKVEYEFHVIMHAFDFFQFKSALNWSWLFSIIRLNIIDKARGQSCFI